MDDLPLSIQDIRQVMTAKHREESRAQRLSRLGHALDGLEDQLNQRQESLDKASTLLHQG